MDYSKSINIQDRLSYNAVVGTGDEMIGFKPSEFVHVMNVDDEGFDWEVCMEETIQPGEGNIQATRYAKIDKFHLEPGQTTEMPGNIALIFIEKIVKHLIQKENKAKMINIPSVQDEWIRRVFLGKKSMPLPYAINSVDADNGARTFRASEIVKDPTSSFGAPEIAFPEVASETPIQETPHRGRPAKATA